MRQTSSERNAYERLGNARLITKSDVGTMKVAIAVRKTGIETSQHSITYRKCVKTNMQRKNLGFMPRFF